MPIFSVTAVVLTHNRPTQLAFLLARLKAQSLRPTRIIVVDTGSNPDTPEVVLQAGAGFIHTGANVGGAAGFALGMLLAQSGSPDFIWLMDDDGYPETDACLETLALRASQCGIDLASPLIIDCEDRDLLAFPHRRCGRYSYSRGEAEKEALVPDVVYLFNGALIRPSLLHNVGLPDARLFIRGDEVDYWYRALAAGCKVATVTTVGFCHPSGLPETVRIVGGWLHAVVPPEGMKRDCFFRNRGYIFKRHFKLQLLFYDVLRYTIYFLVIERGNVRGLRDWARAMLRGMRDEFAHPISAAPKPPQPFRSQTPALPAPREQLVSADNDDGAERHMSTEPGERWYVAEEAATAPVN